MKKTLKSMAAAVTAAVLCAVPMASTATNAAVTHKDTIRVFHYVNCCANLKEVNLTAKTSSDIRCIGCTILPDTGKRLSNGKPDTTINGKFQLIRCSANGINITDILYKNPKGANNSYFLTSTFTAKAGSNINSIMFTGKGYNIAKNQYVNSETRVLVGDANLDGHVDMADSVTIAQMTCAQVTNNLFAQLNYGDRQTLAADVNNDGIIDLRDQGYINQYCNGILADFGSITKDLDYDYYWWN